MTTCKRADLSLPIIFDAPLTTHLGRILTTVGSSVSSSSEPRPVPLPSPATECRRLSMVTTYSFIYDQDRPYIDSPVIVPTRETSPEHPPQLVPLPELSSKLQIKSPIKTPASSTIIPPNQIGQTKTTPPIAQSQPTAESKLTLARLIQDDLSQRSLPQPLPVKTGSFLKSSDDCAKSSLESKTTSFRTSKPKGLPPLCRPPCQHQQAQPVPVPVPAPASLSTDISGLLCPKLQSVGRKPVPVPAELSKNIGGLLWPKPQSVNWQPSPSSLAVRC